jgi:outer membrane protein OmpA-like peptidoglycan-associated protein
MAYWKILGVALGSLVCADVARANVVGADTQNFNPATSRGDFVTVQSSQTLPPGRFSLGLFLNSAANTLPYEDGEQSRTDVNDTLTGMDAFIGAGLLSRLELGLALPFVLQQTVEDRATRGEFAERGNTGVRVAAKLILVPGGDGFGLAAIASSMVGRTDGDPYTGEGGGPIYNLELAADKGIGRVKLAGNIGYRFREQGEKIEGSLVEPVPSQVLGSLAAAWKFVPSWSLIGELYGAAPTKAMRQETDRDSSNAESLLGLRKDLRADLYVHGGVGSELMQGLSTPDWRAYLGVVTELGGGRGGDERRIGKRTGKPRGAPIKPASYLPETLAEIPETEPDEVFILRNINFEYDSDHRVLPGAFSELDKLARYLDSRPYSKIVVEGHTDWHGTDDYNDDLSQRRARAVVRRLVRTHGLDESKLIYVGYGERRPMTEDTSDAGRQLNRRVEIKLYRD